MYRPEGDGAVAVVLLLRDVGAALRPRYVCEVTVSAPQVDTAAERLVVKRLITMAVAASASRAFRVAAAGLLAVALLGTTAGGASAKPAGSGAGNSLSAKACHNGGWQNLTTSTGAAFASEDACVAYAAHGGVLTPKPTASIVAAYTGCTGTICDSLTVVGSGLQPGSQLDICSNTGGEIVCGLSGIVVGTDGTASFQVSRVVCFTDPTYYSGVTPTGAVVVSNVVVCPAGA